MTSRPARHLVRWFLRTFGYAGIVLPPLGAFILTNTKGWADVCH